MSALTVIVAQNGKMESRLTVIQQHGKPAARRPRCHGRRRGRQQAFTLIELMASIIIMSILMGAVASAILLATHAVDDGDDPLSHVVRTGAAVELISADVMYALSFTESTETSIEFTVADRDGDGVDETIRYEWSGVEGEGLTRSYNGGTAGTVLPDVRELEIGYTALLSSNGAASGESVTSDEVLLASYEMTPGDSTTAISKTSWASECVLPTLPGDCESWTVTEAEVRLKQVGAATGLANLRLETATADLVPTGTTLRVAAIAEASLPAEGASFEWRDYPFLAVGDLACDAAVCLALTSVNVADACQVEVQSSGAVLGNALLSSTTDGGSTWNSVAGGAMLFRLYGTITSGGSGTGHQHLAALEIAVRAGDDAHSRVETSVPTLNAPEAVIP